MSSERPAALVDAVGGIRGVIDSVVPTVVFVAANTAGGLRVGIYAAVAAGIAITVLRLARRQPLRQAFGGFFAVAVAAFFAARTHKAAGFFLPGILTNAAYGLAALVSVAIGRPFVGYVATLLDTRYAQWRDNKAERRAAARASLVWAVVFLGRAGVQGWLYVHNHVGWLAAARLGMGLPLFAGAIALSLLLMRGAAGQTAALADQPENTTMSSRWTTSRSYDGPRSADSSRVDRPSSSGSSSAS